MSTQALVFHHNPQSITWAGAGALWALLRTVAMVLTLAIALGGLFALVVAFWWPILQIAGCIGLIAAYASVTFPGRKAPRNGW